MSKLVVAVVVEHTLADRTTDVHMKSLGPPVAGAAEFLKQLRAAGHFVLLVSAVCVTHGGLSQVVRWTELHGLEYDDIYAGLGFPECDVLVYGKATAYITVSGVERVVANV